MSKDSLEGVIGVLVIALIVCLLLLLGVVRP
jgi:hypothetical protein